MRCVAMCAVIVLAACGGEPNNFVKPLPSVVVTVVGPTAPIPAASTFVFTATVSGSSNSAVAWSVDPVGSANVGAINSSGTYTTRPRGARSMPNVSGRSSPCSGMCGTTRGSIGSPYADAPRLTGNGSSSAWSTTLKSSPITDTRGKNTSGRRTDGHQWRADRGRN